MLENNFQEEPQCSKMKSGKLGPVTSVGQSKEFTPNNKTVLSSMQLTVPTQPWVAKRTTKVRLTFIYWPQETTMEKSVCTITLVWLKIQTILREKGIRAMWLQLDGWPTIST